MGGSYDYDRLEPGTREELARLIAAENLGNSNKYYPKPGIKDSFYKTVGKRAFDIAISASALVIFLPVNLVIAVITYADVGSPILFKQTRMGKGHKPFTMVKFRNMTNETDGNGVLLRADKRVTKWGRFVRKTSLDELLNFYSILKGDMSVIGPRPLPCVYEGRFNNYHELRHSVKPGLDCPLRDPSKKMTWANRLDNDAWYAQNISFATDMRLLWLLFRETVFGKDKQARAGGFSEGSFMGYFPDGRVMDSNSIPEEYYEKVLGKT